MPCIPTIGPVLPVRTARHRGLALTLALLLALTSAGRAHSPHDVILRCAVADNGDGQHAIFACMRLTNRSMFGRSFDGGTTWSVTALPLIPRDFSNVLLSPGFAGDRVAFVTTTDSGILKSVDAGSSWHVIDESTGLDRRVLDLAVSPSFGTDGTLMAATATGAYLTTDGGDTWAAANSGLTESIVAQVEGIDVAGTWVLFAGRSTLHRSDDLGATWVPLHSFPGQLGSVAISPAFETDQTLVAVVKNGGGVFLSTDAGQNWTELIDGLSDPEVNDAVVAADGTLLLATQDYLLRAPIGSPFVELGGGLELKSNLTDDHYRNIALSPDFVTDETFYVASYEGLFWSRDRGETFAQADIYHQKYNRQIVFPPDFAATGEVFLVNYGGGLWRHQPPQPPGTQTAPVPGLPVLPGTPAGSGSGGGSGGSGGGPPGADDGPAGGSITGARSTTPPPAPPFRTLSCDLDQLFGQLLTLAPGFGQTNDLLYYAQVGIYRSDDAGLNWTTIQMPAGVEVIRALELSPDFANDQVMYIAGGLMGGAWRSENGGADWIAMTNGLPADLSPTSILLSPDYLSDQTLWTTSRDDGLFKSTDAGLSWAPSDTGITDEALTLVEASPDYLEDGLLLAGGFEFGVFRSTDGGATWTPSNDGLPDGALGVESLCFSPDFANDQTVFVALLAAGVHRSTDAGLTWSPVGPGLPEDSARVVALSPAYAEDATVFVSTHGWTFRSNDGGDSFAPLPGFARLDDTNNSVLYELAAPPPPEEALAPSRDARLAARAAPAPTRDADTGAAPASGAAQAAADLRAWLLDGACEGLSVYAGDGSTADDPPLWETVAWPAGAHGPGVSASDVAGDACETVVFGDALRWYAARGPDAGLAEVSVDGEVAEVIDLYAPEAEPTAVVFSRQFEATGPHRIRVVTLGLANPLASDVIVRSDGFEYTYTLEATP